MKIRAIFVIICCLLLVVIDVRCSKKRSLPKKGRPIWRSRVLTWTFRDPQHLIHSSTYSKAIRAVARKVFNKWSKVLRGRLVFVEVDHDDYIDPLVERDSFDKSVSQRNVQNYRKPWWADIDIVFARGDHGDGESFDGQGGTVAHSAYPPLGIVHLDADELWTLRDNKQRVNLETVLLHEVGHVLGLRHLKHPDSIMNVYYRSLRHGFVISKIDERVIRKLYRLPIR